MAASKTKEPLYSVGDRVLVDYGLEFGDPPNEITLKITVVRENHGGAGNHRYWGDTARGPAGAYQNQIVGRAK